MIDTVSGSPWADLLFNMLASFAQFERSLIGERVRAGMARARRQGKPIGRPSVLNGEWDEVAPLVRSSVLSQRVAAKRLGVGLGTIHRRLT